MIFKDYLKHRKYFFVLFITLNIFIFVLYFKFENIGEKRNNNNSLASKISNEALKLLNKQKIKCRYSFDTRDIYFIAEKNGLNDVFKAKVRVTDECFFIEADDIKNITNTPLSDEEYIYSDNRLFVFLQKFNTYKILNFIKDNKIFRTRFKEENLMFEKSGFKVNNEFYHYRDFRKLKDFETYEEKIKGDKRREVFFLKHKKAENKQKIKYLKEYAVSDKKGYPFEYFRVKIPEKNDFEIYFFDKSKYFLKIFDSGGLKYSKTGLFFKENESIEGISIDFKPKGGFKKKEFLIRPVIQNYPVLTINGKNKIGYGFLHDDAEYPNTLIQFDYPLVFKGVKEVEINNFKINLSKDAQKNKDRRGICLKGNKLGFFSFKGVRSTLIDYLYLIDCSYAVETNTQNMSYENIYNDIPKMILIPRNNSGSKNNFRKSEFFEEYEDKEVVIYKISCGNLSLSYFHGNNDPLISVNAERKVPVNYLSISLGTIDPVNPDGLYSDGILYYKGNEEKSKFYITDSRCFIANKYNGGNIVFFKEGKLIYDNKMEYDAGEGKYKKVLSGISVKGDDVFIYEFKKTVNYRQFLNYNKLINPEKIIVFENYGGALKNNSGKLIIKNNFDKNEIFMLK